jgi:hypothetical protein
VPRRRAELVVHVSEQRPSSFWAFAPQASHFAERQRGARLLHLPRRKTRKTKTENRKNKQRNEVTFKRKKNKAWSRKKTKNTNAWPFILLNMLLDMLLAPHILVQYIP